MVQCLITNCQLNYDSSIYWGDLHAQGDQLIFNAVTEPRTGEPRQVEDHPEQKAVTVTYEHLHHTFHRRGVFVLWRTCCTLNKAARNFLGEPL